MVDPSANDRVEFVHQVPRREALNNLANNLLGNSTLVAYDLVPPAPDLGFRTQNLGAWRSCWETAWATKEPGTVEKTPP